jgi:hypothetical protein
MTTGKVTDTVLAQQLIAGIKKHLSTVSSLAFGNGTLTPVQVETSLQTLIDLRTAVDDARAATKAKIVAEAAQAVPLRNLMAALVAFVKATYGNTPDVLADFGLKPKKARTPLTIQQKAAAAAKRTATRAARHTMGKNQKKVVKGTITTIVTTPPTAASTPVAPGPAAQTAPVQGAPAAGAAPHAG